MRERDWLVDGGSIFGLGDARAPSSESSPTTYATRRRRAVRSGAVQRALGHVDGVGQLEDPVLLRVVAGAVAAGRLQRREHVEVVRRREASGGRQSPSLKDSRSSEPSSKIAALAKLVREQRS